MQYFQIKSNMNNLKLETFDKKEHEQDKNITNIGTYRACIAAKMGGKICEGREKERKRKGEREREREREKKVYF